MKFIFIFSSLLLSYSLVAQFGIIKKPTEEAFKGVTLFQTNTSKIAYLIDNYGDIRHQWEGTYTPGVALSLLENGNLLRTGFVPDGFRYAGGQGGALEIVSWDGTVEWSYIISSAKEKLHHDVIALPNGNILATVWEVKSTDEAIAIGRKPELLDSAIWPDKIIELEPIGSQQARIVWEWKVWDHLIQDFDDTKPNFGVVSENPSKIDANYGDTNPDWNHINGLAYNPELDQIILSVPTFDELWIIDHSTTTEEASSNTGGRYGKGGQILYRWGNPYAYKKGLESDKKLFYQHNPTWLKEDDKWKILFFNNGRNRPGERYSSVEKIELPINELGYYAIENGVFNPKNSEITYQTDEPSDFFAPFVSGAQILANNNILITNGVVSKLFEINSNNEIVWEYNIPLNSMGEVSCLEDSTSSPDILFRSFKYNYQYSGLINLTNQGQLGLSCSTILGSTINQPSVVIAYTNKILKFKAETPIDQILVYSLNGKVIKDVSDVNNNNSELLFDHRSGIFLAKIVLTSGQVVSTKFIVN